MRKLHQEAVRDLLLACCVIAAGIFMIVGISGPLYIVVGILYIAVAIVWIVVIFDWFLGKPLQRRVLLAMGVDLAEFEWRLRVKKEFEEEMAEA